MNTDEAKQALEDDKKQRLAEFTKILEQESRRLNCIIRPIAFLSEDGRVVPDIQIVAL